MHKQDVLYMIPRKYSGCNLLCCFILLPSVLSLSTDTFVPVFPVGDVIFTILAHVTDALYYLEALSKNNTSPQVNIYQFKQKKHYFHQQRTSIPTIILCVGFPCHSDNFTTSFLKVHCNLFFLFYNGRWEYSIVICVSFSHINICIS